MPATFHPLIVETPGLSHRRRRPYVLQLPVSYLPVDRLEDMLMRTISLNAHQLEFDDALKSKAFHQIFRLTLAGGGGNAATAGDGNSYFPGAEPSPGGKSSPGGSPYGGKKARRKPGNEDRDPTELVALIARELATFHPYFLHDPRFLSAQRYAIDPETGKRIDRHEMFESALKKERSEKVMSMKLRGHDVHIPAVRRGMHHGQAVWATRAALERAGFAYNRHAELAAQAAATRKAAARAPPGPEGDEIRAEARRAADAAAAVGAVTEWKGGGSEDGSDDEDQILSMDRGHLRHLTIDDFHEVFDRLLEFSNAEVRFPRRLMEHWIRDLRSPWPWGQDHEDVAVEEELMMGSESDDSWDGVEEKTPEQLLREKKKKMAAAKKKKVAEIKRLAQQRKDKQKGKGGQRSVFIGKKEDTIENTIRIMMNRIQRFVFGPDSQMGELAKATLTAMHEEELILTRCQMQVYGKHFLPKDVPKMTMEARRAIAEKLDDFEKIFDPARDRWYRAQQIKLEEIREDMIYRKGPKFNFLSKIGQWLKLDDIDVDKIKTGGSRCVLL